MGFGGSFENWQFGQVFGTFGMLLCLCLAFRLYRKPRGQRTYTKTLTLLVILSMFTAAMGVVYAVSSAPFYRASARVNEGIDLVIEVSGHEVVDTNRYPSIIRVLADRPDTFPASCIPGALEGSGSVEFAERLDDEDFLALAERLEGDGYTTEYFPAVETAQRRSLSAIRAGRSYGIGDGSTNRIVVSVDRQC